MDTLGKFLLLTQAYLQRAEIQQLSETSKSLIAGKHGAKRFKQELS